MPGRPTTPLKPPPPPCYHRIAPPSCSRNSCAFSPRIGYQPSDRLEPTMVEPFKSPRFRVNFPFLQKLQGRVGKLGFRLLLVLVPLVLLRACALHLRPAGQPRRAPGLLRPHRGEQGAAKGGGDPRLPAGDPRLRDASTPSRATSRWWSSPTTPWRPSQAHRQMPAINVPTVDGYPVDVDVTVLYRLDRSLQGGVEVRLRQGVRGVGA